MHHPPVPAAGGSMGVEAEMCTCRELREQGLLQVLEEAFGDGDTARGLAVMAGIPLEALSEFTYAGRFWQELCEQLERGVVEDGVRRLFHAAANFYPHNERIRRFNESHPLPQEQPPKETCPYAEP